jgi:transaldolase
MMPRFFIDSSDINEIRTAYETALAFGVTTNPLIILKNNPDLSMRDAIQKILSTVPNIPISVQVTEQDPRKMVQQGKEYHSWGPERIVVKIPMGVVHNGTPSTYAIKELARVGIPVNVTSCMTRDQAYAGIAAGARYLSLFWCRIKDSGGNPEAETRATREMIQKGFHFSEPQPKEIIVGSLREPENVFQAMQAGAHIITIPFLKKDGSPLFGAVVDQMINHERTVSTNEEFFEKAKSIRQDAT